MPQQREALGWASDRNTVSLFMEMRLGKSLVVIRWAKRKQARFKLLLAPLAVLPVWESELEQEGERGTSLVGTPAERFELATEVRARGDWCLLNPAGTFARRSDDSGARVANLLRLPWDLVVIDESVLIKNPKARFTRIVHRWLGSVPYRAVLCGLPNPRSPLDLFEQVRFAEAAFMGRHNFWKWRDEHFFQCGYEWVPKKGAAARIKEALHANAFVLTRQDAGLGNKRIFSRRYVSLPQKIRREYVRAEQEYAAGGRETKWKLVVRSWLCELCGGRPKRLTGCDHNAKLDELCYLLTGELVGQSIVVWFQYRREIEAAAEVLRRKKILCGTIHGDTVKRERTSRIYRFQRGELPVILLQAQTMKYGVDLSRADTAIYFGPFDDYESFAQSMDRIESVKKKSPLLFIMLLAKDTIDEDRFIVSQERGITSRSYLRRVDDRIRERWKGLKR